MRYLILSDVHANLEALEAVLADAPPASFDRVVVLGDIVGYGPDPNAVVDRVRDIPPTLIIRGNHDKVASGVEEPEGFNALARQAAVWTAESLTDANRAYLRALPAGPKSDDASLEICHGSPADEDHYLFEELDALRALTDATLPLCFFGHTHVQIAYVLSATTLDVVLPDAGAQTDIPVAERHRYLVNPGAVGQPRDGDPRAAYATFDTHDGRVCLRRVAYDVAKTQEKIVRAGLPVALARRLGLGR
ncbi:MAG: metallophosphoesterase family protein [Vicinamibacterales bacterium]